MDFQKIKEKLFCDWEGAGTINRRTIKCVSFQKVTKYYERQTEDRLTDAQLLYNIDYRFGSLNVMCANIALIVVWVCVCCLRWKRVSCRNRDRVVTKYIPDLDLTSVIFSPWLTLEDPVHTLSNSSRYRKDYQNNFSLSNKNNHTNDYLVEEKRYKFSWLTFCFAGLKANV